MGVVLYVLVCGCLPFDAADMSELRARVLSGRFKVPFFMSPACERLIKRMLTVDPASRIKMADVKNDAWLNEGYSVKLGDPAQTSITVTSEQHEYVLGLMNRMGVPNDVVEQSLAGPDLPHVAATYHLVCDLKFPRKPMHDKVLSAESVRAAAPAPAVAAPAVDAPATAAAGLQPSGKRLPFEDDTVSDGEETAEDDDADDMDNEALKYFESLQAVGNKTGSLPAPIHRLKPGASPTKVVTVTSSAHIPTPSQASTPPTALQTPPQRSSGQRRPTPLVIPVNADRERDNGIMSASVVPVRTRFPNGPGSARPSARDGACQSRFTSPCTVGLMPSWVGFPRGRGGARALRNASLIQPGFSDLWQPLRRTRSSELPRRSRHPHSHRPLRPSRRR